MKSERLGNALPRWRDGREAGVASAAYGAHAAAVPPTPPQPAGVPDALPPEAQPTMNPDAEAVAFVRFCYRRRAVAWPELYDEMCAVAARGHYRGMGYEQLEGLGIRFALAALPRLAEMAARVMAEERGPSAVVAA